MDGVDHTEVDELMSAELASLSKQELIARVLKLDRDNRELILKLGEENVSEEFSCDKTCQNKTPKNTDVGTTKEKKQKVFDFSRYHKRHVAMKLAYLGWDYHGFACQESTENTIEGHFFAALVKACLIENRTDSNYSRCGRTDKGVSAFGQVVSLDVRSNLAEGQGIVKSGDQEKVRERIGR